MIFFVVRHLQSINMASACMLSTPSSSSSAPFLLPSELLPSRAVKPTSLSWASSFPKLGIFGFVSNTSPPIPTLKRVCNFSYSLTFPSLLVLLVDFDRIVEIVENPVGKSRFVMLGMVCKWT